MLEKINTELDLYDNVAFKFWVIEDYSENESLLFGIQNHAFIDGLNFVASMKLLSLDNDMKKVEQVKGMSLWNQLLGKILLPFITLKVILRFIMLPFANNCIKRPPPEVRNKWLAISENFDRDEFQKRCKESKCTFT
jgi:hypothetical protein